MDAVEVGKGNVLLPQIQALGIDGIGLVLHKDMGILVHDKGNQAGGSQRNNDGNGHEHGNQAIFLLFQFWFPPITDSAHYYNKIFCFFNGEL